MKNICVNVYKFTECRLHFSISIFVSLTRAWLVFLFLLYITRESTLQTLLFTSTLYISIRFDYVKSSCEEVLVLSTFDSIFTSSHSTNKKTLFHVLLWKGVVFFLLFNKSNSAKKGSIIIIIYLVVLMHSAAEADILYYTCIRYICTENLNFIQREGRKV